MATHEILNMLPFLGFLITDSLAGLSFCFTLMSSRLEKLKEQIKVMDKFQSSKWKAKTSKCVWDESSVSGFSRYIQRGPKVSTHTLGLIPPPCFIFEGCCFADGILYLLVRGFRH